MSSTKEKKKQKYFTFGSDKQMRGDNFQAQNTVIWCEKENVDIKSTRCRSEQSLVGVLRPFQNTRFWAHFITDLMTHFDNCSLNFFCKNAAKFAEVFYILQSQYDCHFQVAWWWHHVLNTTNMATQHYCYAFSMVVLIFNLPIIFLYWRLSATRCVVTKSPKTPQ